MRLILFLPLLLLLNCAKVSQLKQENSSFHCHKSRVAIDMGSGSTKIIAAHVDKCKKKILKIIDERNFSFKFKESIHLNDKRITRELEELVTSQLSAYLKPLIKRGFQASGVATEVFREAINGRDIIRRIKKKLNISLTIINQRQEAMLGFWGAIGATEKKPEDILVWDIGGGSMQMTTLPKPSKYIPLPENLYKRPYHYLGKLASVSFKNLILDYQGRRRGSPNPIGLHTYKWSLQKAKLRAAKEVSPEIKSLIGDKEVLGIGGVHYFSIRGQTQKPDGVPVSLYDLQKAIKERINLKDQQITSNYKETEVSNLILVEAFMKALKIQTILPLRVNLATGILFYEELW